MNNMPECTGPARAGAASAATAVFAVAAVDGFTAPASGDPVRRVAFALGVGALFVNYDRQLLPLGLGLAGTALTFVTGIGTLAALDRHPPGRLTTTMAVGAAARVLRERIRSGGGDGDRDRDVDDGVAGSAAAASIEGRVLFEGPATAPDPLLRADGLRVASTH